MRITKEIVILILLGVVSAPLTIYTWLAFDVMGHVSGGANPLWRSTPPGSFFPIPKKPGMLQALSDMNPLDQFIYTYLVRTFVLPALTGLLWLMMAFFVSRILQNSHARIIKRT